MTVYLAETFEQAGALDQVPNGWSGSSGTFWMIKPAPAWEVGTIAQGCLTTAADKLITRPMSGAAGSGTKVRVRFGTDSPVTTQRAGEVIFTSGGTDCMGLLFHSDAALRLYMTSAQVVLLTPWVANTLYDVTLTIGAAGAITGASVNGTPVSSGFPVTMGSSKTTINGAKMDVYNGAGALTYAHHFVDAIIVDDSTAIPNGTIAATGTLDGTTLGTDSTHGGVILGYTNSTSPASTISRVERSSDGGSTWATIGFDLLATASGFLIWDGRPTYGSQPVTPGNTATYRVTASNATGDQTLS